MVFPLPRTTIKQNRGRTNQLGGSAINRPSQPKIRLPGAWGVRAWARLSDTELIAACLSGEARAWDALVERYEPLIFGLALKMRLSRVDAEDVFQNVCLTLLDHLGDLRDASRLAGWLASTTRREVWRMQRRAGAIREAEPPEYGRGPEEWAEFSPERTSPQEADLLALEDQRLVRVALEKMPERCRNLLTLLYFSDPPCSYADAAKELGLAVGSIGSAQARCLARLEKILLDSGF